MFIRHLPATFTLAAIAVATTACTQAPPPAAAVPADTRAADEKAIRDTEAAWNQAWATRDAAKITPFYADDATLMIAGQPILHGRADIDKGMQGMLGDTALGLKFEADKVEVSGGLGYTQGHYEMTMTDAKSKKKMLEKGKYLTIYRKQADGAWKAIEDINNADADAMPVK